MHWDWLNILSPAGAVRTYPALSSFGSSLSLLDPYFQDVSLKSQIPDEHEHYSQRAPWLRAGVLGANDGLVSVASLMLGVEGGSNELHNVVLAGVAGLVAGALSMAVGEFVSVSSQRCSIALLGLHQLA